MGPSRAGPGMLHEGATNADMLAEIRAALGGLPKPGALYRVRFWQADHHPVMPRRLPEDTLVRATYDRLDVGLAPDSIEEARTCKSLSSRAASARAVGA